MIKCVSLRANLPGELSTADFIYIVDYLKKTPGHDALSMIDGYINGTSSKYCTVKF